MKNLSAAARDTQTRIRRAQSERDVTVAVLDYLRDIPLEALAPLPEQCRPAGLTERDDIVGFNLELARCELMFQGPEHSIALLREMLSVTSEAASRFAHLSAQLAGPPTRP